MNTDKLIAESIVKEYAPKETTPIVALRKLDARAKRPARVFAFTFGTIATLVAGTGMSLAMRAIGTTQTHMILGIILGSIGFLCCILNYKIHQKILSVGKKKYANDIIELARRISEDDQT